MQDTFTCYKLKATFIAATEDSFEKNKARIIIYTFARK